MFFQRLALLLSVALVLVACESNNDHFCAKYSYYYKELSKPGLLPYRDMKEQLSRDLTDPKKDPDKSRLALFVLEDIDNDMKPDKEAPLEYCLRRKRWNSYHY